MAALNRFLQLLPRLAFTLTLTCLLVLVPRMVLADGGASPLDAFSFLQPLLAGLAGKYGVAVQIFMVIGVLRTINKPLFGFFHTFTLATPGEGDDLVLQKVETSSVYKWVTYVLDFVGSVKLPTQLEQK